MNDVLLLLLFLLFFCRMQVQPTEEAWKTWKKQHRVWKNFRKILLFYFLIVNFIDTDYWSSCYLGDVYELVNLNSCQLSISFCLLLSLFIYLLLPKLCAWVWGGGVLGRGESKKVRNKIKKGLSITSDKSAEKQRIGGKRKRNSEWKVPFT